MSDLQVKEGEEGIEEMQEEEGADFPPAPPNGGRVEGREDGKDDSLLRGISGLEFEGGLSCFGAVGGGSLSSSSSSMLVMGREGSGLELSLIHI